MDILLLLIPLSLVLVALIGGVFVWSVKSGQYDDLEGPAHRILADDDDAQASPESTNGAPASLTPINPGKGASK
jgi:cbb3-type cytochrome oxidase maturation protein